MYCKRNLRATSIGFALPVIMNLQHSLRGGSDGEHDGRLSKGITTVCQDLKLFCYSAGILTELSLFH